MKKQNHRDVDYILEGGREKHNRNENCWLKRPSVWTSLSLALSHFVCRLVYEIDILHKKAEKRYNSLSLRSRADMIEIRDSEILDNEELK